MAVWVQGQGARWRLEGSWPDLAAANQFLEHLRVRSFAPATVRAYAYDVLCFARFCLERGLRLAEVVPADVFDWVAWQAEGRRPASGNVVRLTRFAGAAPSSVNRRVAAVRALFEHQVVLGAQAENPVPAPRRGQGLRAKSRGVLGHLGPGRRRGGGRLVRASQRLPEALEPGEVAAFLADLSSHRDRAITLAMLLGGLRAGEVRSLRLADIDQGLRRLRVCGKGGRERVVPVDRAFFAELAAYLRVERPPGLVTPECFVILAGATAGGRSRRPDCAASFAITDGPRVRPGCARTGCATPTAPSWQPPASTCWCCAS